ncbi:unnamed protein product [Cylicocyclus nassatus]|uniref:Uncharacterized protein n=1 Tax=Cylicocyclus nassatus TaxID=53992 RepID=A0AA36M5N6_CYLNA|nr:unnamed protein product [Cylicocyclus nassatus]
MMDAAGDVGEDPMESDTDGRTTPSVQRATSTATSSGSHFSPGKHLDYESDDERLRLKETKAELLDQCFLVQGKKLLELFFLTRCNCEVSEKGRWEGQDVINSSRIDKLYLGNALACIAATTTGVRMNKLTQWSTQLGLGLPSLSAYKRVFTELRPSIEVVHEKHRNRTIQQIRTAYEVKWLKNNAKDVPLPGTAVDGAFDSRSHSAELCKVLAVDLKIKLCIHTEVVSRRETGNVSGAMEKEGFRRLLRFEIEGHPCWLDLNRPQRHAAKRKNCEVLKPWIQSIKKHLYYAIDQGALTNNKEHIRHIFNGCLNHVAGIHEWSKEAITGPLTQCHHQALSMDERRQKPVIAKGTPAHEKLKEILLQPLFQKDLARACSLGGTSPCETKNALDRLYCPKDLHLPRATYTIYTMMSTLHMNALKEAELRGERVVERRDIIKRKFNDYESILRHKTPIDHLWRKEIYTAFITHRSRLPSAVPLEGT